MTYYSALHYAAKAEKSAKEAATYNYKNAITNCITEIPQDIKLELNNGTLTLKAGSKVYALDGSSYTIPTDVTFSYFGTTAHSSWILVKENGEMFDIWTSESASNISIGSKWVTFGGTNCYLPICLATHNADGTTKTGWKSIDQVFNGFGYIGSTVFALPGVKGLIPNGRNADGSLKNLEFVTDKVLTFTNIYGQQSVYLITDGEQLGLAGKGWTHYNSERNTLVDDLTGSAFSSCIYGMANTQSDNKIISFTPKQAFHAVDRSDSSWIAQQAMPSNRYIDLTLGASGSTYIAPANGWFVGQAGGSSDTDYVVLSNDSKPALKMNGRIIGDVNDAFAFIPVQKGDLITFIYKQSAKRLRFFYAEGEN